MSTYYTCSIISTTPEAEKVLKSEMTTPTSGRSGIPNRQVTSNDKLARYFDRIGTYYLTKAEYKNLSSAANITSKQLLPSGEALRVMIATGSESIEEATFLSTQRAKHVYNPHSGLDRERSASGAWNNIYLSDSEPNAQYSGSFGSHTENKYFTTITQGGWDSPSSTTNYDYVLDGTGVDLIIMDGTVNHLHAEFFDKNGNTRVQYPNWYTLTGQPESASSQPAFIYTTQATGSSPSHNHGTMVASLAGGLVGSFAKNATIYILPTSIARMSTDTDEGFGLLASTFAFDEAFGLVKRFHESKSIDLNTGYKRPTVTITSQGFRINPNIQTYLYPTRNNDDSDSPGDDWGTYNTIYSASIDLNIGANEGIRFFHGQYNYVFVSSSTNVTFDSRDDAAYYKGVRKSFAGTWFYSTFSGSLNNLVPQINNAYNGLANANSDWPKFFITCSAVGNTLSITSSFYQYTNGRFSGSSAQRHPVSVYTGSFDQNNNFQLNTSGPYEDTGSFVGYLGDPSEFENHINLIVTNGVHYSSSNSAPYNTQFTTDNSMALSSPNRDIMGVPVSASNIFSSIEKYNSTQLQGGMKLHYESAIHNEIFQEVASAGVIIVKAGGNANQITANSGSSIQNPFFTQDQYDPALSENYFTYDIDTSIALAGEKIYYNRNNVSNGSIITVGAGPTTAQPYKYGMNSDQYSDLFPPINWLATANYSVRGPNVDIFTPPDTNLRSTPKGNSSRMMDTNDLLKDINFDFQSVIDYLEENFSSLSSPANKYQFFRTGSQAYSTKSSGTSAAGPIAAGAICCFLQMNPWANVNDVRKWLRNMPSKFQNMTTPFSEKVFFKGNQEIDITGSRIPILITSGAVEQLGTTSNSTILNMSSLSAFNPVIFNNITITKP